MRISLLHLYEYIFYLFVLSLPFINTAVLPSVTKSFGVQPCHILFLLLTMMYVILFLKKNYRLKLKNRTSVYVIILFILISVSTTFLMLPFYQDGEDSVFRIIVQCIYLIFAIMVYIICSFAFSNGVSLLHVMKVFENTFWIVLLFQIYQLGIIIFDFPKVTFIQNNPTYYLQGFDIVGNGLYRLHSTFPEVSMLSSYLGVFFPIFLIKFLYSDVVKERIFAFLKLLLVTLSLIFALSFTSIIIICNSIIFCVLFSKQKLKAVITIVLSSLFLWAGSEFLVQNRIIANSPLSYYLVRVGTVFTFNETSAKDRSGSMAAALKVWERNPIIGVGEAVYPILPEARFEGMSDSEMPRVHSLILKILSEHGLIGSVLYIMFVYFSINYCFKTKLNKYSKSINLGYGIAALNIIAVQIFTISDFSFTYMWFFLAVTAHLKLLENNQNTKTQINGVQFV